ncbi:ATP-binding protein [Aeromicrobium sp. 50.2.37]|uniref:ATP-binding protein n=1 Tax=Aeromicrobium sp. 50.2.37 TaxID=2969305 RepID=UPI00214F8BF6|nr:ATP-binding protein [Aeromicrobium sp. 50.2.37]MCR4514469.1 ATP-binding protein [Aeromicrobium sp. 50.2.37]
MRSAIDNPFTPGADVVPPVWAGRRDQLQDWESVVRPRRAMGLPERGRTILGEAGLGKSTLVRRIALMAEREGDWVTPQLRIPLGADPLKAVASAMLRLADRAGLAEAREQRIKDVLARVREVAASGISLTLDRAVGPEPYVALTDLLVEVGAAALAQGVTVVVHIDEVQNITDEAVLSQLLVCLGDVIAHETVVRAPGDVALARVLPVAVYLTGLPEFADMAGSRKGATFARRFATTTLAPIADDDLRMALHPFVTPGWEVSDERGSTRVVRMEPAAADLVVRLSCGEPFLFQLAGERSWYAGTGPVITVDHVLQGWEAARYEATAHVERILQRLPARERQMVEVMAAMEPVDRTATKIAREMGFETASQAAPTAQRLDTVRGIIDRGRQYTFRHRAVEAYLTTPWPDPPDGP